MSISVLMIGPDRSVHGGISGVVNNLYDAGLDQHIHLTYIGTMKEGGKAYKLWTAIIAYIKFRKALPKCDIVHVHVASDRSYLRKSIFIKKAASTGKDILIHQHGGDWEGYYNSLSPKQKEKVKEIFDMGAQVQVLSPWYRDFFVNTVGIDADKIQVFPDTIKIPDIDVDVISKMDTKPLNLLFLGRLCEAKGIRELVEAVSRINSTPIGNARAQLTLAGIWEDESLKFLISKEPYKDFVHYFGWANNEEKVGLFKESDILVLPSYFEGQSVSILEAMAYGLGIVATNVGGIPMMIEDGVTGILVEPRSVESLQKGIERLSNDRELLQRLGKQARMKASNDFNIDNTVDSLVRIYEEIYEKSR